MWVVPAATHARFVHTIAHEMREADRLEIFATRAADDPDELANAALATGDLAWVAGLDQTPIAAFGCAPMWPGVWSMWLFATDLFPSVALSVTKLVTRRIVPMLFEAGAHRLEARSMEGHHDAQSWLELIGARRESTLTAFGKNREDFHVYTWTRP